MVYWGLRRKQLCDPNLCPDRPAGEERCPTCPLNNLEDAEKSEKGQLLRRSLDMKALINIGIKITLDEIAADEMYTMLIIEEEQARYDKEIESR